jgi:hypothetical protein
MMEEDPEDRVDPMSRIFLRLNKYTFNKFGPSDSTQRRDALCVLPVNTFNEVGWLLKRLVLVLNSLMFRKIMSSSGSG